MYRITEVRAGDGLTLHLTYADGATVHADVSGLLQGDAGVFAPLRDRAFFDLVQPGRRGRVVTWPGELDLDADVFRMGDDDPDKPREIRTAKSTPPLEADPVSAEVVGAIRASGLTQAEIARRMGTQQPQVARLADPNYHGHSLDSLRKLAAALGLEVEVRLRKAG